jgi:DNA helicase-2/ATP-dependent DNA helicase PcrA
MRLMEQLYSHQRFPEQPYPGPATSPYYHAQTQDYNSVDLPGFISSSQAISQTQRNDGLQHWRRSAFKAYNNSQPAQVGSVSTTPFAKRALSLQTPSVLTNAPVGASQAPPRHYPPSYISPKAASGVIDVGPGETGATEEQNSVLDLGTVGSKRRLGVGRNNVGYANKKFKPPIDFS